MRVINAETLEIVGEPCGCYACDDGVEQGHFACSTPPGYMLDLEKQGRVSRAYDNGAWRWYATTYDRKALIDLDQEIAAA